jgi:hypothetical protein
VTHRLHTEETQTPFLCSECAEAMGLETVSLTHGVDTVTIYDYQTGEVLNRFPRIHNWQAFFWRRYE